METFEIDRAVIFGTSHSPKDCIKVNDEVADYIEDKERLIGFACVPSLFASFSVEELDRCVKDLNLSGVKIFSLSPLDSNAIIQIIKKADQLNIPVLVHSSILIHDYYQINLREGSYPEHYNNIGRLLYCGELAKTNIKLIAAHLGGGAVFFKDYIKGSGDPDIYSSFQKLYFDTSPWWPDSMLKCALEIVGDQKIVFGSDYPYPLCRAAASIERLRINKTSKAKIFHENAERILH